MNLLGCVLALALALFPTLPAQREGQELVGTHIPAWPELRWVGQPLRASDLHGKVVLVRWWSDACPMCSSALPSIAQLHKQYEREGLVVVGIFHPKPARSAADIDMESVNRAAKGMGAYFPIAVDAD